MSLVKTPKKKATKGSSKVTPVDPIVKPNPVFVKTINVDEDDEDMSVVVSESGSNRGQSFEFTASIGETPFCCGLREIGNFTIQRSGAVPQERKIEAVKEFFAAIVEAYTHGSTCKTIMFTLVENEACHLIAEALEGTNLFTAVKTFHNTNNRVNTLYVSNN